MQLPRTKLILLFAILTGYCFAQPAYKKKYKDLLEPNSKLLSAGINFTLEELTSDQFLLKRYYPENRQITHRIALQSINPQIMHGPYEERYDDGTILHQGRYENNKKEGTWIEQVKERGAYRDGKRTGRWIRFDANDRKNEEWNYIDGVLDGLSIVYDTTGAIKYQDVYQKGELLSSTRDSIFQEIMPRFPGCERLHETEAEKKSCADRKMLEFVYSNIKYPPKSRETGAEGEAIIKFTISEDGTVTQIEGLRKVTKEIGDECINLIKKMPQWIPAVQNGRPVKVQFYLPVKFSLGQ